ncbi:hypothetical protein [Streptomyces tanashiensis]|uniref:hypothetical protein n=1 Tax=Streptomyces tanashiensis TaxID=67367 RepID=UPI0033F692A8
MGLAARQQGDGKLLVLLNPHATPERLRSDVQDVLGHLIGTGLLAWVGGPRKLGLP